VDDKGIFHVFFAMRTTVFKKNLLHIHYIAMVNTLIQNEESHQSVTECRFVLKVLNHTRSNVLFMHWCGWMILVSDLLLPTRKFQGILVFNP